MASSPDPVRLTGRCECGAVRFALRGPPRPVINCHCAMCRRLHGHFAAYTAVAPDALLLVEQRGLRWYRSSDIAERGFCGECGASLFWRPAHGRYVAVAAGALDPPTGLRTAAHIFVADKGDYYDLSDDLPRHPQGSDTG